MQRNLFRALCSIVAAVLTAAFLLHVLATSPAVFLDNPIFLGLAGTVADPITMHQSGFAADETALDQNGRIWTDKSVAVASEGEFHITLSAQSQSFQQSAIAEPTDTVFVIDVSRSMYVFQVGQRSRVAALVDALNMAMQTILQANPNNRVAVVAYGGRSASGQNVSRVHRMLALRHYNVPDGQFFSMSTTSTVSVHPAIADRYLPDGLRTITVDGATPTQRGIHVATQMLLENDDITFTQDLHGESYTVPRRPNIILMTDGEPTIGWLDYRFADPASNTDTGFTSGNGLSTDMGLALLTVLSAAYHRQLVQAHYFGENTNRQVGFYTIAFGDDTPIVHAAMDPFGPVGDGRVNADLISQSGYNMRTLLDQFATGQSITFPALNRGSSSQRAMQTVHNPGSVTSTNFVSRAFSALDEETLNEAFRAVTLQIIATRSYSTHVGSENPDFAGRLIFTDVLGEFTQVRGIGAIWYDDTPHTGAYFAHTMQQNTTAQAEFVQQLMMRYAITQTQAEQLLQSNIAAGNIAYTNSDDFANAMVFYINSNRSFLGSAVETDGSPAEPPPGATAQVALYTVRGQANNPVTDQLTDLQHIGIYVITVLVDSVLHCGAMPRILQPGQQVVQWSIPASLLPLRTFATVTDEHGMATDEITLIEAEPIRLTFAVGMDSARVSTAFAQPQVQLFSNDWSEANAAIAFFVPNEDNPYYQEGAAGAPVLKAENATQTATHVRHAVQENGLQVYRLGNNGRVTAQFKETPTTTTEPTTTTTTITTIIEEPTTTTIITEEPTTTTTTEPSTTTAATTSPVQNRWIPIPIPIPIPLPCRTTTTTTTTTRPPTNQPPSFPQTGDRLPVVPVMVTLAGLAAAAALFVLWKKRTED